ncbi:hypothetical protein CRYUN_Cryun17cG0042200 [Craigia yunnanensis]
MFSMKQRKTEENRGFISSSFRLELWLLLFLIWTFEETIPTTAHSPAIPETTATNSLSANKYMRGFKPNIFGRRGVTNEEKTPAIDNPQIPGSNASNSLTDENLRSFRLREGRKMLGANVDSDTTGNGKSRTINYNDIPRSYPRPNSPPKKAVYPYRRACNPAERCRKG